MAAVEEQLEIEHKAAVQGTSLDSEIHRLRRKIKSYGSQEKQLVQLFRYQEINQDTILDELNQLKREREADKQKLESYVRTKERVAKLEKAEIKVTEYCQKLKKHLDAASYNEKREMLDMLAIRVTATPDHIDIEGVIPLELTSTQTSESSASLLTIERTWA
jgi:predicted RNase H-like nuclease (RuvC/YqgF family)